MRPTAESVSDRDLTGRAALVTGASSGLGAEVARVLALRGATVFTGCRSHAKTAGVTAAIESRHGREVAARVRHFPFDGEAIDATSRAAADLAAAASAAPPAGPRLDLVFLNAGTFAQPFRLTPEGHEATFAGNFLGHVALVRSLVAGGGLSPDARLIATLSEGATMNPFARADLEMLERPRPELHSIHASPHTKVLLALFLTELARRLGGSPLAGVRCAAVMPSATLTNNVNTGGAVARFAGRLLGPLLFRSVGEGAAPLVWAALEADLPAAPSLIARVGQPTPLPRRCSDPALAAATWAAAARALGLSEGSDVGAPARGAGWLSSPGSSR